MKPIKDPMPIICDRCEKVFMGKYAYICPECRKKVSSETAKKTNLNKLGNEAYSKQQKMRKDEGTK
jgi:hypothetical protein